MIKLPSKFSVLRFTLAAWILMAMLLLIPATAGAACYSMFMMERGPASVALALILLTLALGILLWCVSSRARCPRCLVNVFSRRSCSKHGSAKSLLGSHRMLVASTVIFKRHFQCPYCGEFTAVRARDKRPGRSMKRSVN